MNQEITVDDNAEVLVTSKIKDTSNWNLCLEEKKELISRLFDRTLKINHSKFYLDIFWILVIDEYLKLVKYVMRLKIFNSNMKNKKDPYSKMSKLN